MNYGPLYWLVEYSRQGYSAGYLVQLITVKYIE
jgi:hypothetical protein